MPKKVYDIIPPSSTKKKILFKPSHKKIDFSKLFSKKKVFIWTNLAIFLLLFLGWFFSSAFYAEIQIYPSTKTINSEISVLVSTSSPSEVNPLVPQIKSFSLVLEKTVSGEFKPSLSQSSQKAHGVIRVYNKYRLPVTLVKGTRFLSSTKPSKVFLSQKKITIPANGYIDVKVIASEPGEDYNIDPCAFSVPGLRNFKPAQLYYDVYAKSFSKMQGGGSGKIFQISESDLEKAKRSLTNQLESKLKEWLNEKAGNDEIILDKTINYKILESGPFDAKLGQITNNFIYKIKARITGLVIKKKDLNAVLTSFVNSKTPPSYSVFSKSLKYKINSEDIDLNGDINLQIEVQCLIYPSIDFSSIKDMVKNQPKSKAVKYIREIYPNLSKQPKLLIRPFFARKMPKDPKKIDIKIKVD